MNNSTAEVCSDDFPHTNVYYSELGDHVEEAVVLALCLLLMTVSVVIYIIDLLGPSYRYNDVIKRQRVLVILAIYPMTSFLACFALLVPTGTSLLDLVQTCHLSVCLYFFIELLIQYFGGKSPMTTFLSSAKIHMRAPPCCCCLCCLPSIDVHRRTLIILRGIVMQVAIIRPLILFVVAVVATDNSSLTAQNSTTSLSFFMSIINAVSTLMAMYGLVLLVRVSREALHQHKINIKFVLLQLVLIFTNLQSTIFLVLRRFDLPPCRDTQGPKVRASIIHHMILVFEMSLLFFAARRAYRKSEHRNLSAPTSVDYGATTMKADDVGNSITLSIKDKTLMATHSI